MARQADPFDLMIFARVVEAGSFSLAAERLGLPKSTVSRRISALEAGLGERLVQRTTRKLVLTEMGQRILTSAEQIVHEVEIVTALAEDSQVTPSGRLRVSMPSDLASITFAPMLARFAESYPAVQLELDLSPDYVDVLADSFDLAIRIGGEALGMRLTTRHLLDIGIGLYASPAYIAAFGEPDMPQSLARHSMLVLHTGGEAASWRLERGAQVAAVDMSGRRVSANSYDLLLKLASAGAGIAALPDIFVRSRVASGELKRVLPDWQLPPAMARAVFPSRKLMPRKTRVFLDDLLDFLKPKPLRALKDDSTLR
ncbi:LysR family transcriptional regulator [Rhizobium sp. KVB221]|uniref:HTH-type transcriptional regulator TtuA n=1 Tax=Rhizobium setariae TaxID=2801340 RepID=A0A936YJV4_9HYPH|nr:LysR family transcriptional regulator [Rhizobium setariae]MBL0370923.1 LysR family transcriptional regulator [Rhizobium setariae]